VPAADQDLAYVSKSAKIEDIINQASEKKFKSSIRLKWTGATGICQGMAPSPTVRGLG
jgi:hypothetical protein